MRAWTPGSYHDGGDHHGAVLQAGGVVGEQRGVLDQHQLVRVVPVADLSERRASAASVNPQTCSSSASFLLGGGGSSPRLTFHLSHTLAHRKL